MTAQARYADQTPGVPHGVMFHHFHGPGHHRRQGSLDREALAEMIDFLRASTTLLPAEAWIARARASTLGPRDICLTFDDCLRCQYDLVVPMLAERGLTGIFFVYSSVLRGEIEPLEIDAHVRHACFPIIETFYDAFSRAVAVHAETHDHGADLAQALAAFDPARYKPECTFYTDADRQFRFVRDHVLSPADYRAVMDTLVDAHVPDRQALAEQLWMAEDDIRTLRRAGHVIGLHSDTHPTNMRRLDRLSQEREYAANQSHLERLLGEPVRTVAHPCGVYDAHTLAVLRGLGVDLGFRADMGTGAGGPLETPRQDHAHIARMMAANR